MIVAIDNFMQLNQTNKITILGDMFELGSESYQEHKAIVDLLIQSNQSVCYLVGREFYATKIDHVRLIFHENFESLSKELERLHIQNSSLLIKGSRGMALERVLDYL
jgi:UDP-N-acetylmuramoyl-tripeptide--D-alanyl-D-alanine ligase